jgi:hypothetical protein
MNRVHIYDQFLYSEKSLKSAGKNWISIATLNTYRRNCYDHNWIYLLLMSWFLKFLAAKTRHRTLRRSNDFSRFHPCSFLRESNESPLIREISVDRYLICQVVYVGKYVPIQLDCSHLDILFFWRTKCEAIYYRHWNAALQEGGSRYQYPRR